MEQKSTNASESVADWSGEAKSRSWTYIQAIDIWQQATGAGCKRNRIETAWSTAARIATGEQSQPEGACGLLRGFGSRGDAGQGFRNQLEVCRWELGCP